MRYLRIYAGDGGASRFEDVELQGGQLPISPKSDPFAISVFRQQTWREFICMTVETILGVSYRKQTASFV